MKPLHQVIINKDTSFNPIWIMRQAGRYLPEFREIREKNPDFIKLCLNDNLSFKHRLIKLEFFFLISLNSGKYLPACLIIHIGLNEVSLLINILCNAFIK